jgi:phosphate-selective porin O/P
MSFRTKLSRWWLVVAVLAIGLPTLGQEIPDPTPPPAPTVEGQLRSQAEMIRQLAEQNRRLAEQLKTVTKRLDDSKPDAVPKGDVAKIVADYVKDREQQQKAEADAKKMAEAAKEAAKKAEAEKPPPAYTGFCDEYEQLGECGLKSLFDSLHPAWAKRSHWYEKLSVRGYTQFRFTRTLDQDQTGADAFLFGDRSVNGNAENFSIRRARLIISGDVSDHLALYFQTDFANTPPGSTSATFFAQLRDLYGDVYVDKEKVHRFRVGLSKVPYGFENMQSSQNRAPLDRTVPLNTAVAPNERDLGVFYYWTPVRKQRLLKDLVDGGLKGSGNYGILGLGVYNGQGGSVLERDLNLHTVARLTWPWRLDNGQVVEASVQGFSGRFATQGAAIRPLGQGPAFTPRGSSGNQTFLDHRIAGTFVWYPQPFGFQAEWNVGRGPGLNDAQTDIQGRSLQGGYVMALYKLDTENCGIFFPYVRYQSWRGGYRSIANAPYGNHDEWNIGLEWQIFKEMELVTEYGFVDGVNLNAINLPGVTSYRNFDGGILRFQFQINY